MSMMREHNENINFLGVQINIFFFANLLN